MRTAFNHAYNIAWTPNGDALAISCHNNNVVIWERGTSEIFVLEGHVSSVASVTFSFDGALLCSNSCDGKVTVWDRHKRQPIASFEERAPGFDKFGRIAFHPTAPILATLGEDDRVIRVWDLRFDEIGRARPLRKSVRYTSAKIVLVGESNVGKSCLAMRLAEDRYPDDHEHGTTHGMRFWPMEAEKLHPAAKPPDGQRRDVVLWDFGGQDEYQLVHQMFLHDTTLALVLIDPTRGRAAMDEARDWNKRLEKHLGKDRAVKLLVGAKVDKRRNLIDQNSIDALCKECRFTAFLDLSAKTGRNTRRLRKLISDALDWDRMAKTSRPELFQGIRDDIEARRKKGEVVVLLDTLTKQFEEAAVDRTKLDGAHTPESIDHLLVDAERAVVAVSDQLATQGVIVKTKLMTGEEALVLRLEVIERYAGSLIIAARNNPRGVPVLEERLLGSTKTIPLPGMTKKERLGPAKERMVLECIVELMIQHGICFRHGGLLVFPTLFPASGTVDEKLPHSISLYYDFTGAIDNIYASLVSKLMVSEEFGEGRLRAGRVEFERGRQGICVLRQIKRAGGLAHVDLFFSENTKPDRKDLFTRFVEEHLRTHGVDIREHQAIKCKCGFEISESIIEENIVRGESDVICPVCRKTTAIGEGVDRIRQRNPETDAKMVALRKTIDKKVAEDIKSAKKAVAGEIRMAKSGDPIRILHLSDLHFTDKTNPETKLGLLLQDIRQQDEHYAAIETVEYLVISGDMTDKGKDAGFEKARQFVAALVEELGLSFQRSIFVPGNHDVQDRADAYEERETEDGSTIKVRHPDNFPKRFEQFSNGFFHPLLQRSYPLNYAEQGISYLFPETGIQFLTLNSAWEIDKNGRKKAGIQPDAVAGVIARADDERKRAVERDDLKKTQPILRIGVWHHAVAGPELMQDLGFLTQLQKAGMKLCLHGDVHESRTELFGYRRPGIEVEILGAGSFGSAAEGRPESTPRLYNMLEVTIDPKTMKHTSIRVHTREQKKENESWQGCHAWTNPKGGRLPFFDIQL
jgi:small GTP-binding protein